MNYLNYIGKDCRNLIWKKLSNSEKFPILFVSKKYKKEMGEFTMHYKCFSLQNKTKECKRNCLALILQDLIEKNYFDLVKLYYDIFQNETILFYILYYSARYNKTNIFKHFFALNGNKVINYLILREIIEKESLELIKFLCHYKLKNFISLEYNKLISSKNSKNFINSMEKIINKNEKSYISLIMGLICFYFFYFHYL